jgi:hypothetical protein
VEIEHHAGFGVKQAVEYLVVKQLEWVEGCPLQKGWWMAVSKQKQLQRQK